MRGRDFTNFVSSLAMLNLLWRLNTICSLTSYIILCFFVIYHLHRHRQESGTDYISENFNMDRLYEERPEIFVKLTKTLNRLNCRQHIIHSLDNDGAIPNGCATAAVNTERPVSNLTRLPEGGSQQLPRSSGNTAIDLEASMIDQGDREVSTDHPHTDSEYSDHDLSCSDLEEDSEAHSHNGHAAAGAAATETVPKTVIIVDKAFAAETEGSVDTNTADESKTLEDNLETVPSTVIRVNKALAAETKANDSDLEEDSEAQSHNGHTTSAADAQPKNTMVAETEILVDTNTDDESTVLGGNSETIASSNIAATKPEENDRTISQPTNDTDNAMECSVENSILPGDSDNQTLADTNESVKLDDKLSIKTEENDKEVSLSRSNSPSYLGEEEDSKLTQEPGRDALENRCVLPTQPAGLATVNTVTSRTEEATPALSPPRENNQESGPEQVESHKPQESCEWIRHEGNQEQGSSTCIFSPTDDPGKLHENGLDLSPTYPLEDRHDNNTVPVNLQKDQTCADQNPPSTPIDLKDEHEKCSDQDKGCLNQDKQMTTQTLNLQHDHSSDVDGANYTSQSDAKAQHNRHPDQDNGCVDGLSPSSHEASADMQAANLKDQKKQKVMVVAKEEGATRDGRPSVKTPRTEEDLKETQSTSDQLEVSMSQSAKFHQTGNQPLAFQQNHHEKWPTESSSDSENESKGDHSAKVP